MNKREYSQLDETLFETQLPNGLHVRVMPKRGFAKTYAFLATNYGSIDMAYRFEGKRFVSPAGVAHYLEHKMFDLPDGNAMQLFAKTGASPNAFTSYSMTAYYFVCTDEVEENLKNLLQFVYTPYFTEESVEKERGIIAQEIRMYEDSADSRGFELLAEAMYEHHPLRIPIAGSVESIQEITAQTLYDCHKAFYDPANMILCVVGDVDPAQVMRLAREHSPAGSQGAPERDYGPEEALTPVKPLIETNMEVSMPSFTIGFKARVPGKGFHSFKDEIIGELAAEILAGESSALYSKLYDAGLVDADFSIGYESLPGAAFLSADGDSKDPQAVLQALLDEAQRLVAEGLDETGFQRLKKSALGRRMRDLDSFESICYRICAYFFEGCDYLSFPGVYASVSLQDVADFLRETVCAERAAMSVIYPKEKE